MSSYLDYVLKLETLPPPRGLPNYGNTCWLNALCQMLLSFVPFNEMLGAAQKTPASALRGAWLVFVRTGNPSRLRAEFTRRLALGQQCADEALCVFLDELNCGQATTMLSMVMNQYTQCRCGEQTKNRDQMYRVVIYPPPRALIDVLRENITPLSGFACKCGRMIESRREVLGRVDNAIIVVFQQYDTKFIYDLPEEITLPSIVGPPHKFLLVAQIEHSGGRDGGHYWARVRRAGGVFKINDESVSPSEFMSTPETYMAGYFRV